MPTNASRTNLEYFKLATFCLISMTWKDGKKSFASEAAAIAAAKKPGKYRVSRVHAKGRVDLEPIEVT